MSVKKNTIKIPKLDVIIDWFEFTIKSISLPCLCEDLGIKFSDLLRFDSGLFGYDITFVYKEKIKFLLKSSEYDLTNPNLDILNDNENRMGIHVILSGYACREIETEIDWDKLIQYAYYYASKISRIDIAYDVFSKDLITIKRVMYYLKRGLVVSQARNAINTEKRDTVLGKINGHSIRFGSSSSNSMLVIYDKLQERHSANYIVDKKIKNWYRIELRLRNETAQRFLENVIELDRDVSEVGLEVLNGLIAFKDLKNRQTIKSSNNRCKMENADWWIQLIGDVSKLRLSKKAIQTTIQRKQKWIEKSVEHTLASVFVSNIEDVNTDSIIEFITNGIDKINSMSLQQINEYRISKQASVLDDHDLELIKQQLNMYTEK